MVKKGKSDYKTQDKEGKRRIVGFIYTECKGTGRFLTLDKEKNNWIEAEKKAVFRKIAQALREKEKIRKPKEKALKQDTKTQSNPRNQTVIDQDRRNASHKVEENVLQEALLKQNVKSQSDLCNHIVSDDDYNSEDDNDKVLKDAFGVDRETEIQSQSTSDINTVIDTVINDDRDHAVETRNIVTPDDSRNTHSNFFTDCGDIEPLDHRNNGNYKWDENDVMRLFMVLGIQRTFIKPLDVENYGIHDDQWTTSIIKVANKNNRETKPHNASDDSFPDIDFDNNEGYFDDICK
jgi:hypothetical protein